VRGSVLYNSGGYVDVGEPIGSAVGEVEDDVRRTTGV
jgi:hypothetical protein